MTVLEMAGGETRRNESILIFQSGEIKSKRSATPHVHSGHVAHKLGPPEHGQPPLTGSTRESHAAIGPLHRTGPRPLTNRLPLSPSLPGPDTLTVSCSWTRQAHAFPRMSLCKRTEARCNPWQCPDLRVRQRTAQRRAAQRHGREARDSKPYLQFTNIKSFRRWKRRETKFRWRKEGRNGWEPFTASSLGSPSREGSHMGRQL